MITATVQTVTRRELETRPHPPKIDVCGVRDIMAWRKVTKSVHRQLVPFDVPFQNGVMLNVEFRVTHQSGCGFSEYLGHAYGELHEGVGFKSRDERKLVFNRCYGDFMDAENGKILKSASVLILREGLHSAYIP